MTQISRVLVARDVRRTFNAETASAAVGPLALGCEIYGLSKGQFSLCDLLLHVLDHTGPADVVISTWTAANADLAHCRVLLDDGRITRMRWVVDFSFPARQPAYCAQLRERFGDDAIAVCANHAKFLLVRAPGWNVAVRTSMNLNRNRRLESYEISESRDMAEFLSEIVEATFRDGATIGEAVAAPGYASSSTSLIAGAVDRSWEQVSHGGSGCGISHD